MLSASIRRTLSGYSDLNSSATAIGAMAFCSVVPIETRTQVCDSGCLRL
jgi:hypothetical protein